MSELQPCPQCRRHVRSDEATCPFCAVSLRPAPAPALPVGRLARAAVFASAALASACGSAQTKPDQPTNESAAADAGPADASAPAVNTPVPDHDVPMPYGAPPARRRMV